VTQRRTPSKAGPPEPCENECDAMVRPEGYGSGPRVDTVARGTGQGLPGGHAVTCHGGNENRYVPRSRATGA